MSTDQGRALDEWLQGMVTEYGGAAGTVHEVEETPAGPLLILRAAYNIPPKVVELTRQIPKGKGMAGLAWERGQPVQTCNLQTDDSGDVRPGAKAVGAQAAVALPVVAANRGLRAVVGIAFLGERDLSAEELARLQAAADRLPETGTEGAVLA